MRRATAAPNSPQAILAESLSAREAAAFWGAGYPVAFPVAPQDFTMAAVLPAVLYTMRWGHRRGSGKFETVYGRNPSIERIAAALAASPEFDEFDASAGQAILGDLLLAFCLENRKRTNDRTDRLIRVLPAHYFSSWVDLPITVTHLRGAPELLVALLARQRDGSHVTAGGKGHFPIGAGVDRNAMLRLFAAGVSAPNGGPGQEANLTGDRFDERVELGVDQLLGVRLGLSLGSAPLRLRGEKPEVPNQLGVATEAAERFFEDLNVFLRAYGSRAPRQSLLQMLESGFAVGFTTLYLSTLGILLEWERTGRIPPRRNQRPWPLLVDCSMGTDRELRQASEAGMDDVLRRLRRLPGIMLCLRILDYTVRLDRALALPPSGPDPAPLINLFGDLLFVRGEHRDYARDLARIQHRSCSALSDALEEAGYADEAEGLLQKNRAPFLRLAEAVVSLMGEGSQFGKYRKLLDSGLMVQEPHGIGTRRRSTVQGVIADRRSIQLSNSALDYLVHRHLCSASKGVKQRPLSLSTFLTIMRDRYGFYVREAPPGMELSAELLARNQALLERRLRDLGLLRGVNDAESMKRLEPRFRQEEPPTPGQPERDARRVEPGR